MAKKLDIETDKNDEMVNKFMEKAGERYTKKVYSFIEQENQPRRFKNSLLEQDADDFQK